MPFLLSDHVRIAYELVGAGPPIILLHGFASNRVRNWKDPRWFDTLTTAGRQVVALDFRGHGESDKPHDPGAYSAAHMTGDVIRVLDHLGMARVDVMGYSMGARIAAALLARHPARFNCGILAGIGAGVLADRRNAEAIAHALETSDKRSISDLVGSAFRQFAEAGGNDLIALAACMRGLGRMVDAAALRTVRAPVLIVVGERDTLVGDPRPLADLIPGAELVMVPNKDHLTTVGAAVSKENVLRFLDARGLDAPARAG